jgi:hypothetical protein
LYPATLFSRDGASDCFKQETSKMPTQLPPQALDRIPDHVIEKHPDLSPPEVHHVTLPVVSFLDYGYYIDFDDGGSIILNNGDDTTVDAGIGTFSGNLTFVNVFPIYVGPNGDWAYLAGTSFDERANIDPATLNWEVSQAGSPMLPNDTTVFSANDGYVAVGNVAVAPDLQSFSFDWAFIT